ncbi:type IV pilus modification protein PilV [Lysobacter sp. H21R4]|uniref:type IV pilus modification protein PilV n=1 Tax=Lysobacter sp. H21R4 TaxID=2781021 RepID=UPI001888A0AE|nr:type IV pilus modification protein PilV [Lysobacter sp. H21R4]QOY63526.1 type IV pilus modification protein PilV [Lysobacter sp. H21R4]
MKRSFSPKPKVHGFSLIEVMIAILVMAFGLLGFALLQTMSVRFAQSSNYRTQATNLAYDMLDQMRSNRLLAAQYGNATFSGGTAVPCTAPTGDVGIPANISRWQCQVRNALGEQAAATVTFADGNATVAISWADQRWEKSAARKTNDFETGRVTLGARL